MTTPTTGEAELPQALSDFEVHKIAASGSYSDNATPPQAVREPYRGQRSKDSASVTLDADTLARKGQWIDEQPAQTGDAVATQWLAEMIMSDCGCSTRNQRLLERIIDRIQQYDRANTAPQPVAREPLTDAMVSRAGRALSDVYATECGVDKEDNWKIYGSDFIETARLVLEAAHGIKGGQHVE